MFDDDKYKKIKKEFEKSNIASELMNLKEEIENKLKAKVF